MTTKEVSQIIAKMDTQLRSELLKKGGQLQKKKLWENIYIKHQIDRRNKGELFLTGDHIRAMVYSMLTGNISWARLESGIDEATGKIPPIDEIFHQYNPSMLLQTSPEHLRDEIQELHFGNLNTLSQMEGLIHTNIPKLLNFEKQYGSVDAYYAQFIKEDASLKTLVKTLSDAESENKMTQLGIALTAEYLRNVGYDIAKPDRHILRILGNDRLACSEKKAVSEYEALDIIAEIASECNKHVAEVDYILWSYCAKDYGEVCVKDNPKCDLCVANNHCNKEK